MYGTRYALDYVNILQQRQANAAVLRSQIELTNQIRDYLVAWQSNDAHLQPLFAGIERLTEVQDVNGSLAPEPASYKVF